MGRMIVKEEELKPNYYALYLSIIAKYTVSKSVMLMNLDVDQKKRIKEKHTKLTGEDYKEIIELKTSGLTWFELADKFEIRRNTLFAKIKRYMGDDWENRGWR